MAEVFGVDFGTTNSLVTYIGENGRANPALDAANRPHPSVVWFRGEEVIVGREAREHLDSGAESLSPDFVRSPKRLLGREHDGNAIPGRRIDRRDVVAHVLDFLKRDLSRDSHAPPFQRGVFTVPVGFNGAARRDLREAARRAGLGVVYFVHEPLAALYAYLRSQSEYHRVMAELDGRYVLVFDWGGGTLDLTLCQISGNTLLQVLNSDGGEVGGDRFDDILRNFVRQKHASRYGLADARHLEHATAPVRLIHRCELAKIELSSAKSYELFLGNFLATEGPARTLRLDITRDELERETAGLVRQGLGAIHRLLEEAGLESTAVELCLPTGGMVNMPAVRNGLNQIFPGRVAWIENGDKIISEGAAWIAYDGARPVLAKPIEIVDAAQSPFTIVPAGLEMPVEGQRQPVQNHLLYCADPRDGVAVITFQRPTLVRRPTVIGARECYGRLYLKVDPNAPPLVERLTLDGAIDHDYVARFDASSTGRGDQQSIEIHDLEFAVRVAAVPELPTDREDILPHARPQRARARRPLVRSNITTSDRHVHLVPGDIVESYFSTYLDNRQQGPQNQRQHDEANYYRRCTEWLRDGRRCNKSAYEIGYRGCDHCGVAPRVPPEIADARLAQAIAEEKASE